MGIKPAALFVLKSGGAWASLRALLPAYLHVMILRRSETGLLVFVFAREKLEKAISGKTVKAALSGMGYPAGASVFVFLDYLKKQFENRQFPHEIGFFLGYPPEDVLGFVKHRGENYKLCGYWKVYGNVGRAKRCFRRYDKCRERLGALTGRFLEPARCAAVLRTGLFLRIITMWLGEKKVPKKPDDPLPKNPWGSCSGRFSLS
jgi:hypothetical protein